MVLSLVIKVLFYFCAFASLIMFLPGSILLDIHPKAFFHRLPRTLEPYRSIETVTISDFKTINCAGPESIAYFEGKLVTGSVDGYLYQILEDDTTKRLIRVVEPEEGPRWNQKRHPRPLGLRFDSKGRLFVVEPSYGIFKVEGIFTTKPKVSKVLDIAQTTLLGSQSKFFDDLAFEEKPDGNHVIYISDVSSKFDVDHFFLVLFGSDTTGRILRYDMASKKLEVAARDLFFPNGVEMTPENRAVLFSEFATRTMHRHGLKGSDKSQTSVVMSQLPSEVDNIRLSATGQTYWLAMLEPRTLLKPNDFDYYLRKPLLRKLMLRTVHLAGTLLASVTRLMPNDYLAELAYELQTMAIFSKFMQLNGGLVVEIDETGTVLNSFYSNGEDLALISEVREVPSKNPNQRVLYLGSFALPYVRKMILTN